MEKVQKVHEWKGNRSKWRGNQMGRGNDMKSEDGGEGSNKYVWNVLGAGVFAFPCTIAKARRAHIARRRI